jgi:signal transduction histidine kinase
MTGDARPHPDGDAVREDVSRSASISLRAYLAARMKPLVALLIVLVAISAPLADYVLTLRALRLEAAEAAHEVVAVIDSEVQERPVLWRYGSLKLLSHVRTSAMRSNIARIEILDLEGARVELGSGQALGHPRARGWLLWESAPLLINGETVGHVWVAARSLPAAKDALFLLLPFSLLALGLAALVYWLPLRAVEHAERRIGELFTRLRDSRRALADFNQTLEQQVAARSVELRAAYEDVRRSEVHLREVSSRAIALQEAERRVIARELHDSAGQAITAIRINVQMIAQGIGDRAWAAALGEKTLALTDETLEEIRRAVVMLGPAILDDFGLAVAVRRYCDDFEERSGVEVTCEVELPEDALSPALESTCYRIVQEALTNVARHAAAVEVSVRLRVLGAGDDAGARVELEIEDDGQGFEPRPLQEVPMRPPGQGGRGLVGIRERVELLGGTLTIDASSGQGTRISAVFPLHLAAPEARG